MKPADPIALTETFIAINSANPATCPIGAGESELALFCADWCTRRDLEVSTHVTAPGRVSVLASSVGTLPGPTVLLTGHLDTYLWWEPSVTPADQTGGRLGGPGAMDMKAGIAMILTVLDRIRRQPHRGVVRAVLTADEEHRSTGLRALLPVLTGATAAIVTESTNLELGIAHDGRVLIGAKPDNLRGLHRDLARWANPSVYRLSWARHDHDMLFRATIPSGVDAHVVASSLAVLIGPYAPLDFVHVQESFETGSPLGWAMADALARASRRRGCQANCIRLTGWTEAGMLAAAGIPAIVFGPGGDGAHTSAEWVDAAQVGRGSDVLTIATRLFLR